jgi:hypothetical protein
MTLTKEDLDLCGHKAIELMRTLPSDPIAAKEILKIALMRYE